MRVVIINFLVFFCFAGCVTAEPESVPDSAIRVERIEGTDGVFFRVYDADLEIEFLTGDRGVMDEKVDLSRVSAWRALRVEKFVEAIAFVRSRILSTYPHEVIRTELATLVIPANASLDQEYVEATSNERSWASRSDRLIVLNANDIFSEDPKRAFDLFNHEFGHLLTLHANRYRSVEEEWRATLPEGFLYLVEANEQRAEAPIFYHGEDELIHHGFASSYAEYSIEEDLAETVAAMTGRLDSNRSSPRLERKKRLIRQIYREVHPGLNAEWFESQREYRRTL